MKGNREGFVSLAKTRSDSRPALRNYKNQWDPTLLLLLATVAKNGKTDSRFGFDKKRRKKEEEERLESLLTRWRGRGARYR